MSTYTVKKGDTLSSIAKQYGTTYQDIAKANGISDPNKIYAGQTLTIGGNDTQAQKTTTSTAANKTPTATTATTTPTTKEFSYDDFKVSEGTAAADKKRQELASQKPGEFTYDEYVKSDIVKQAEAMLEQQLANKPGEYSSQWQAALDETMNKILNREKFSYDLNGDALYQQYKDQYMLQGQQAMMDTMGQAAAMTGGYGNSYAQSVGQQTYQGYLQQLNDKVPELYQLALDQYNREGEDLYNQYGLYADRENTDYGRYRDTVSDYYTELDRLTENARYLSEDEYNKYMDDLNLKYGMHRDQVSDYYTDLGLATEDYWNQYNRDYGQYSDDKNFAYTDYRNQIGDAQYAEQFAYQQDRDKTSDEQWQKTFDEGVRQFNANLAEQQQQHKDSIAESQANREESKIQFDESQKSSSEGNDFKKATFARTDDNGNNIFYIDGKEYTFAPGVNPYTGTTNKDTKNGTFSNGYQPNNVNGQKLDKSGITDVVNGVTQNVWKTPDGKLWIWDGTQNKYLEYQE